MGWDEMGGVVQRKEEKARKMDGWMVWVGERMSDLI